MINFIEIYKTVKNKPENIKQCFCYLDYDDYFNKNTYTWYEYNDITMGRFTDGIRWVSTAHPWLSPAIRGEKYDIVYNRPTRVEKMNTLERFVVERILANAYKQRAR